MEINCAFVSVIIPSYNHADYIEKAIISVMEQASSEINIQLIVVDDKSTDKTFDVVSKLKLEHDFEFIVNDENIGVNKTIEKGLHYAKGEYISFLASDDFFLDGKVRKQVHYIKENDVDAVYGKAKVYTGSNELITEQSLTDFSVAIERGLNCALEFVATDDTNGPLLQSACFKRKAAFELCDVREKYKSDDWVVLLYLLKNKKVGFLNDFVLGYRLHDKNSHKNYWVMFLCRIEVIARFLPTVDERLIPKALANLFVSHGMALYRDGKKTFAFSFFISSFFFSFPIGKIKRAMLRFLK